MSVQQIFVEFDGSLYSIRYAAKPNYISEYSDVANSMARSFEFTP
jgi:hypothetical protein